VHAIALIVWWRFVRVDSAQVGYMQGASGIVTTMLWLDAVVSGAPNVHIVLPDDLAAGL
jgi:hypothetical protein